MKKMKKILAMLLALTMVLGTSLTAFAANDETTPVITIDREDKNKNEVYDVNENGVPEATDSTTVTITGITGLKNKPTITLYQIAKGTYGDGGKEFIDYSFAPGVKFAEKTQPTASEIVSIANGILNPEDAITAWGEVEKEYESVISTGENTDGSKNYKYTATVNAGMYIAIITGADDGAIYNPILLSAYYDTESNLQPGKDENDTIVDAGDIYLYGTDALAKKTTPSIDKTITGGTEKDDYNNTPDDKTDDKDTVKVGDVVNYQLTPEIPSYPENAVNKTLYITDTMTEGLTFLFNTLKVTLSVNGELADDDDIELTRTGNNFYWDNKLVATAWRITDTNEDKGFGLNFVYDTLIIDGENAYAYTPIVEYSALVNDKAVVGKEGNTNETTLYYTNKPNQKGTWDPSEINPFPTEAEDIQSIKDDEIVYTYELAIHKVGEGSVDLADAIFGVYTDPGCTNLIDKIQTNSSGYAVSTKVTAGTYFIKEIEAPDGYSLNKDVFEVKANWKTVTTKNSATVTDFEYTSVKEDAINEIQVGWIVGGDAENAGTFCGLDTYTKDTAAEAQAVPAYLKSTTTTTTTATEMKKNDGDGAGTATTIKKVTSTAANGSYRTEVNAIESIPNTKLISLPSTGGIGTTIFTVVGCGIMIAAAFFFFASRKKENE